VGFSSGLPREVAPLHVSVTRAPTAALRLDFFDFVGILITIKHVRFVSVKTKDEVVVHVINPAIIDLLDQPTEFTEGQFRLILYRIGPPIRSAAGIPRAHVNLTIGPSTNGIIELDTKVQFSSLIYKCVVASERQRTRTARRTAGLSVG
jgi:hypothetical protein